MEIKRESSINLDDDFHSLPPLKRLRADYVDAESNTTNSGKLTQINIIHSKWV